MHSDFARRTWEDTHHDIHPEQTELATERRVPFLTSSRPRWRYVTGITVGNSWPSEGLVPTDEEVELVAGWLTDYCDRWYDQGGYRRDMKKFAPFDIDSGANSVYFIKHAHGGWGYRRYSWTRGSVWVPRPHDAVMTLEDVIARTSSR